MIKRICIFGASITRGGRDPEGGGWVGRLRKYVESRDRDARIYNMGISGNTTEDLLKRLDSELEARKPEIIIFGIGTNDASYWKSLKDQCVTPDKFKDNLGKLLQQAKKFTEKVIFVGLTPVDEKRTLPIAWAKDVFYKNEYAKQYTQLIQDFCVINNLLFIDVYDVIGENDLEDGLHPNSSGHEKMFQRVKDSLIKNKFIN